MKRVDPLIYISFQPVNHSWYNKDHSKYYINKQQPFVFQTNKVNM